MKKILSENLRFLRKKSGKSQSDIGLQLNKAHTSIGNWEKGISEPSLSEIEEIARIFEISTAELLFSNLADVHLNKKHKSDENGKNVHLNVHPSVHLNAENERETPKSTGEISPFLASNTVKMPLVVVTDLKGNENIVHVPAKARAGYLIGYGDPEYIETLYSYNLPGFKHGTYRSFEVDGQSMKPTLLHRDWVVGEWVESFDDIRENRIHIIVTKNDGILIKRVLNRISERNKLYLKSDTISQKKDYPVIELDPSEIAEIWYARIRFSPDFSEPAEIYTRMDNMEIAIYELQKLNGVKPI